MDLTVSPRLDQLLPGFKLFCVPLKEMEALDLNGTERVFVKFPETCELRINGKAIPAVLISAPSNLTEFTRDKAEAGNNAPPRHPPPPGYLQDCH